MSNLLRTKRPSRRNLIAAWFAARAQRRRRRNAAIVPVGLPAPVLLLTAVEWGGTAEGWADVVVFVGLDTAGLRGGALELFYLMDSDYISLGEVAPNEDYRHEKVTQVYGEDWTYVAQYRTEQELGPMSAELVVEIPPP